MTVSWRSKRVQRRKVSRNGLNIDGDMSISRQSEKDIDFQQSLELTSPESEKEGWKDFCTNFPRLVGHERSRRKQKKNIVPLTRLNWPLCGGDGVQHKYRQRMSVAEQLDAWFLY